MPRDLEDIELAPADKRRGYGISYIRPGIEDDWKPRVLVEDGPVDDGDEEGKRHDGGIVEAMECLQGSRPAIEPRAASDGIEQGVHARDEHVEQNAPEGQVGEVAEGLADEERARVHAIVDPVRQDRGQAVGEDQEAEQREQERWEQPRSRERVLRVESCGRHAQQCGERFSTHGVFGFMHFIHMVVGSGFESTSRTRSLGSWSERRETRLRGGQKGNVHATQPWIYEVEASLFVGEAEYEVCGC